MPNSLQSSAIASPASRRATNCSLSSITEHSFQGIIPSPLRGESVTYVSGTMCYLCLRPLTLKSRFSYFIVALSRLSFTLVLPYAEDRPVDDGNLEGRKFLSNWPLESLQP